MSRVLFLERVFSEKQVGNLPWGSVQDNTQRLKANRMSKTLWRMSDPENTQTKTTRKANRIFILRYCVQRDAIKQNLTQKSGTLWFLVLWSCLGDESRAISQKAALAIFFFPLDTQLFITLQSETKCRRYWSSAFCFLLHLSLFFFRKPSVLSELLDSLKFSRLGPPERLNLRVLPPLPSLAQLQILEHFAPPRFGRPLQSSSSSRAVYLWDTLLGQRVDTSKAVEHRVQATGESQEQRQFWYHEVAPPHGVPCTCLIVFVGSFELPRGPDKFSESFWYTVHGSAKCLLSKEWVGSGTN